jgi:NAD dependent epimerase/dehydratase family enzyme
MKGSYNAVAPSHSTNDLFTITLAQVLQKRLCLPNVPAFLMKLILGEMSDMILEGSRVSSNKIIKAGFNFKYNSLTIVRYIIKQRFSQNPLIC